MAKENQLRTQAWLLWGLTGSLPGSLKYENGYLSYTAHSFGTLFKGQLQTLEEQSNQPGLANRLNNAKNTLVFNEPIKETRVSFPWYYFSGGMKIIIGRNKYRFSFAQPNNEAYGKSEPGIIAARKIGKNWQTFIINTSEIPGR